MSMMIMVAQIKQKPLGSLSKCTIRIKGSRPFINGYAKEVSTVQNILLYCSVSNFDFDAVA